MYTKNVLIHRKYILYFSYIPHHQHLSFELQCVQNRFQNAIETITKKKINEVLKPRVMKAALNHIQSYFEGLPRKTFT